ncbi:hypothetical protein [Thermomonas sp.]|uniref:hypothetical protein n=1 Tax=Thermomonas sp. TaxID=1971895 RepID=UPI00262992AD|nr:hypothetical protein [Thermomonas sp.]
MRSLRNATKSSRNVRANGLVQREILRALVEPESIDFVARATRSKSRRRVAMRFRKKSTSGWNPHCCLRAAPCVDAVDAMSHVASDALDAGPRVRDAIGLDVC